MDNIRLKYETNSSCYSEYQMQIDHILSSNFEIKQDNELDLNKKQKKKRIRKRRVLSLARMPRIPKSDIRRQYAAMFSNVYNSCDFNLLSQYLDQFYHENLAVPVHAVISYASGK